jgi:hypothetical protein
MLEGHTWGITSLVALGAGHVVSGSDDSTLRVWNAATGNCERTLEGHTLRIVSLAALCDGRVVSTSGDDTLRVWNIATGKCDLCVSKGGADAVALLALPRLDQPHDNLTDHKLSAVGSCLVGPGFTRTYLDAVVTECVYTSARTASAVVAVAGTHSGAIHFLTSCAMNVLLGARASAGVVVRRSERNSTHILLRCGFCASPCTSSLSQFADRTLLLNVLQRSSKAQPERVQPVLK